MANENKVQFGLKNVHYAVRNESGYAAPISVPGAVNLSLDAEGDMQKFYADDVAYFTTNTNNGYSGDLEMARFPDKMLQDIWGYKLSTTDKVLSEDASAQAVAFALLFQISGDQNNSFYVLYNCTASRPGIGSKTKEETTDPNTQTTTNSATPMADGKVFAKTTADTPEAIQTNWFKSVYTGEAS